MRHVRLVDADLYIVDRVDDELDHIQEPHHGEGHQKDDHEEFKGLQDVYHDAIICDVSVERILLSSLGRMDLYAEWGLNVSGSPIEDAKRFLENPGSTSVLFNEVLG